MPQLDSPGSPEDVLDLIEDDADLIVPLANGEPVSVPDPACYERPPAARWCWQPHRRWTATATSRWATNCDYVAPFIGQVPLFLEINDRMPRTFGRNQIHVTQLTGWVHIDRPLVEVPPATPSTVDEAIAGHVAARIPDRATLQVGIGAIPSALLACAATTAWACTPNRCPTRSST